MQVSKHITRATYFIILALAFVVAAAAEPQPQNAREYSLHIERQAISEAFRTLNEQTGVQYGYLPTDVAEEQILVGPIVGRYTIDAALMQLVGSLGFTHEWINERTVSIISPVRREMPSMPEGTVKTVIVPGSQGQNESRAGSSNAPQGQIESMLVSRTRLWTLEFELPSLIVLDDEDIRALGVSTVAEVLEYLPQQPYMRSSGLRVSGEQYADLRGLGPDSTLILINGRRVSASATSFDSNAFDLNTIPVVALERIEILLDSMAVAAGADAAGGVINFILKERYGEATLEARYGMAAGGAEEVRLSAGADRTIASLRVSGLLDYFARGQLLGEERDRWRNQDYRRFGGADLRSPDANPGNVSSTSAASLPGLASRFAAVPNHAAGDPLTIDDFRSTAGTRNLESSYAHRSIIPETERLSFVGTASISLPHATSAFGELLVTSRTSKLRDLPVALSNVVVPSTNPHNPFGAPVSANFRLSETPTHAHVTEALFARALIGVRHEGPRWTTEISLLRVDDSARVTSQNEIDPANVAASLAAADPALALNVFDVGAGGTPELVRSLFMPSLERDFDSHEAQLSAHARGRLVDLPAGPASTLFGVQYREPEINVTGLSTGRARRTIRAAFAELQLPLLDDGLQATVTLNLASRWDQYSDFGNAWNSHAALAWRPTRNLMFRGSYGTSFRAPSLWELHQPNVSFPFALPDPKRRNEIASVTVTVGGNSELNEARANSWSLGFKLNQPSLANLQLTGSWWHVYVDQRLTPVTIPALFVREDLFPDRLVRATPSESDIAGGLPGHLLSLDLTATNVGLLSAGGFDLTLSCSFESSVGRFAPALQATWINEFTTADVPGMGVTDRVARASIFGTIPKWRAVGSVAWSREPFSAAATARFVSRYADFNVLQNRASEHVVRAHVLVDLQASFDAPDEPWAEWSRGMRLTLGVNNLFDREPQFAEAGGYFGFDPTQGDLRRRFAYLRLSKRF